MSKSPSPERDRRQGSEPAELRLLVPDGGAYGVYLAFQPSRGRILEATMRLEGGDAPLLEASVLSNRQVSVGYPVGERDATKLAAGTLLHVSIEKQGEPLELAMEPLWITAHPEVAAFQDDERLHEPTLVEIQVERERRASALHTLEAEPNVALFLAEWDRETTREDGVPEALWTDLSDAQTRIEGAPVDARVGAIEQLEATLELNMRARGNGSTTRKWADLDDAERDHLDLVDALHQDLFQRHFGRLGPVDVAAVGRVFFEFAQGTYRADVELNGRTFSVAQPNSYFFTFLAEMAVLLEERSRQHELAGRPQPIPGLWAGLLPVFVGAMLVYRRAYCFPSAPFLTFYSPKKFVTSRPALDEAEIEALATFFRRRAETGELAGHWRNVLHVFAPSSFVEGVEGLPGTVEGYLESSLQA